MIKEEIEILKRALSREKDARKSAEKILEDKSMEPVFFLRLSPLGLEPCQSH